MKIRIEIDPTLEETEVVIKCRKPDEEVVKLQEKISGFEQGKNKIVFYKGASEFFLPIEEVLFFETDCNEVYAHTADDEYRVLYKLYELEEILPRYFLRISKSAILNTKKVYSIAKNITASSRIEFVGSQKTVYVSRNYYRSLKERMSFNS